MSEPLQLVQPCNSSSRVRWDNVKEINAQFTNYQQIMDYMNSQPEMKINVSGRGFEGPVT